VAASVPALLADENTSHHLISACHKLDADFPIVHISTWQNGACRSLNDPALLLMLRDHGMVLVSFDRATMAMHAATLTRQGVGHAGIILFRRSAPTTAYGHQAKLLVGHVKKRKGADWTDRIEYLPPPPPLADR
jgi:hypothetical protein